MIARDGLRRAYLWVAREHLGKHPDFWTADDYRRAWDYLALAQIEADERDNR